MDGDYAQWKGWDESAFARFNRREARYYAWHVDRALDGRAPQRVLEVGFGNGTFLGYGRSRGWDMTGVEISTDLRSRAQREGFSVAADVAALPVDASFDLIVLFDVLEHLESGRIVPFMRLLDEHLAAGGAILLRVPNGDSPFGRRHQHGDLTHRVAIGEFMLRQIASACGLEVTAIGESPWHAQQLEARTLRAWCRSWLRAMIDCLIGFAYYGGRVDLSPNLAAVLRPAPSASGHDRSVPGVASVPTSTRQV